MQSGAAVSSITWLARRCILAAVAAPADKGVRVQELAGSYVALRDAVLRLGRARSAWGAADLWLRCWCVRNLHITRLSACCVVASSHSLSAHQAWLQAVRCSGAGQDQRLVCSCDPAAAGLLQHDVQVTGLAVLAAAGHLGLCSAAGCRP